MCKFESLKDGTLSLYDVSLMNDALDVQEENERRYLKDKETKPTP